MISPWWAATRGENYARFLGSVTVLALASAESASRRRFSSAILA